MFVRLHLTFPWPPQSTDKFVQFPDLLPPKLLWGFAQSSQVTSRPPVPGRVSPSRRHLSSQEARFLSTASPATGGLWAWPCALATLRSAKFPASLPPWGPCGSPPSPPERMTPGSSSFAQSSPTLFKKSVPGFAPLIYPPGPHLAQASPALQAAWALGKVWSAGAGR